MTFQDTDKATSDLDNLWKRFCNELTIRIGDDPVRTWFHSLRPIRLDPVREQFVIAVPGAFHLEWLQSHYVEPVTECAQRVLGNGFATVFEVGSGDWHKSNSPELTEAKRNSEPTISAITAKPPVKRATVQSLKIDPDFCFETFVAGEENRLPRSAAMAVAQSPGGNRFNPLLIHGGVGLGKTHLLHAIANLSMQTMENCHPVLTNAEQFTSDFIRAVQHDKKLDFADQYGDSDILLVDDVQFFMGREQTQRQFFHTFNTLINAGKQIVMTSDRTPKELDGLEERLRSRFSQGLVVEVMPPEYETRVAILRVWAERDGVKLPVEVEDFLAAHITSNVRNLRGAVIRLLAIASLEMSELSVAVARRTLHDLLSKPQIAVTVDRIIEIVSRYYRLAPELFSSKSRKQPLAEARMIVMALSCELTGLSLAAIGARLGGRDHTTILHGRETIREKAEHDPEFNRLLEQFKREAEHGITI